MEKMTTRQRIVLAALELFSERGYDGVGVDQIADAVGIKGPSLYNHFRGKEEILNTLIETFEAYYAANFGISSELMHFPDSVEEMVAESMARIQFTMHDPQIRKIRRFLTMEQFRNDKLKKIAGLHELTGIEDMYSLIFSHMMDARLLRPFDPKLLAMEFCSPVTLMIRLTDREPEREQEALDRIRAHMEHFSEIYRL